MVGIGTKMSNGCTSGHGVQGLARFSLRSWVAVPTFMVSAIAVASAIHNDVLKNSLPAPLHDALFATVQYPSGLDDAVNFFAPPLLLLGLAAYCFTFNLLKYKPSETAFDFDPSTGDEIERAATQAERAAETQLNALRTL